MNSERASNGVGERRKPRMQRVRPHVPLRLTGSQREVLALLHEYGFMTPRLLALIYGARDGRNGRGYWHLQRELRRLFDAGLVEKFPSTGTAVRDGSAESLYAITHQGARASLDAVEYAAVRHEIYNRESKHRANFEHHLSIATLQVILTLGQGAWRLVEFRAEDRNPSACVRVRTKDKMLTAWPDAMAIVESDRGGSKSPHRMRFLFEIDRSRRSNQRIADRFLAYAGYLAALRRESPGAAVRPAAEHWVVFAVPSEGELERYLEIAGETLTEHRLGGTAAFLFWNMSDWFVRVDESGGVTKLRPAAEILRMKSVATLAGESRRLIENARHE